MSVWRMLVREAWRRKGNFLLSLFTMTLAVALFVALYSLNRALEIETTRQMKNLGFNLVILPENVTREGYWSGEFGDADMPDSYVDRLVDGGAVMADHFSGRLEKRLAWEGHQAILTGVLGTRARGQKEPLGLSQPPEPGTAFFGFEVAAAVKPRKDAEGQPLLGADGKPLLEPVTIMGESFIPARRLARREIKDDLRIYLNLRDAQRLLGKPGRIHVIEAIGCRCEGDVLAEIQQEVGALLNRDAQPGDRVRVTVPDEPKFFTREKMRSKVEGYAALVAPVLLLACVLWIAALSYMNVRQRRGEIGLLRALGVGSGPIAWLFLGKGALIGLLGAALGFAIGTGVAQRMGPRLFDLPAMGGEPLWFCLWWSLAVAPAMTVLASSLPALLAVAMDPAEALREE